MSKNLIFTLMFLNAYISINIIFMKYFQSFCGYT